MHTPAFQMFRHTLAATALAVVLTQSSAQTTRADETGVALYVQQIKPALEKHCAMCHDGQSRKGGLDVTFCEAARVVRRFCPATRKTACFIN